MFELSIDKSIFNLNKMSQNKQNKLGTKIAIFGILEIFKEKHLQQSSNVEIKY